MQVRLRQFGRCRFAWLDGVGGADFACIVYRLIQRSVNQTNEPLPTHHSPRKSFDPGPPPFA